MLPATWIPHARTDGETLGWIEPVGDAFSVYDRLGRRVGVGLDWLAAEELLEGIGIGFLAERWVLRGADGVERSVRIAEVHPDAITVVTDDYGAAAAVGASVERFRVPFPAPDTLRLR